MKIGFFVTCVAMTVQGFETSGDGTIAPETTSDTGASSVPSVTTVSAICEGKCDSKPNTECKVVQSNTNGFACPCIAGFELNGAGQCTEIINDTTVSDNISTVSTATVDLTGDSTTSSGGVNAGPSTQATSETTNPKIIQPGMTFKPYEDLEDNSTPKSGSIISSVAGVFIATLFL